MIVQITPLVQVAGKRLWVRTAAAHTVGFVLSTSLLGVFLGAVGLAVGLEQWSTALKVGMVALCGACALRDVGLWRWPIVALRRQTPAWFPGAFGYVWGAFAWGIDLGQGWTTYITFTGYYCLLAWAVLSASPAVGALLFGLYGFGRALPVIVAGLVAHTRDLADTPVVQLPVLQWVNGVTLALVAGYMLAAR